MQTASYWINHLNLQPHPEGGYYREIFRSDQQVLRQNEVELKHALTSIYYLLEGNDYSGFHRIKSDELWYFHKGSPLHIHVIEGQGSYFVLELSDGSSGSLSSPLMPGYGSQQRYHPKKGLRW